jgi:raffinose/stachyose/melibiose transport system permease protein
MFPEFIHRERLLPETFIKKVIDRELKGVNMERNTFSYKLKQILMFAGPGTILFFCVVVVPFIYGLYLTFTSWDGVSRNKPFVGFANYASAFADTAYWQALGRTAIYSIFSVIFINVLAFLLAYLVTSGVKGQNFFRAGFFVPNLIGGIVLGYVWKFVFNRAYVAIASSIIGGTAISPLSTPGGAMFCLIFVSVWQYAGYMMLIYVAGFMSVSDSLKEAAMIDGCTPSQAMRNVTIPLMRSSFVQCIFLSITRCFVVYDVNLSLTKGEPFGTSVMAAMHVYNTAFTYKNFGMGQAEALILFIVCAVVGVTQVVIGKKGEVEA